MADGSPALRATAVAILASVKNISRFIFILPNVKDEPRWELARRVQHYESRSSVSFRERFRSHAA
jgi:hypothetical protein